MKDLTKQNLVWHIDGAADQNGLPNGLNNSATGTVLKPWKERKRNANELMRFNAKKCGSNMQELKWHLYQPSPLPGTVGLPIQFAIVTTESYNQFMGSF